LAPDFIPLILGDKWIPAISGLRFLSIAAVIYALVSMGNSTMYALGKPRYAFYVLTLASISLVVLLIPLTNNYGLTGAAIAVIIGNSVGMIFLAWTLRNTLKIGFSDIIHALLSPLAIGLFLGLSLVLTKSIFRQIDIIDFIGILGVGIITFLILSVVLWKFWGAGPIKILVMLKGNNKVRKMEHV